MSAHPTPDPSAVKAGDTVTLLRGNQSITDKVTGIRPLRETGLSPATHEMTLELTGTLRYLLNPSPWLTAWSLVSHQAPPAPEVEPGAVGTATVRVGAVTIAENAPGVWVEFDFPDQGRYLSFVLIHGGAIAKAEHVHDFTPTDPDTAALRAEVERLAQEKAEVIANANILEGQRRRGIEDKAEILRDRDGHRRRADAAGARLARLTAGVRGSAETLEAAARQSGAEDGAVHWCARTLHNVARTLTGLALVAADEQAAEEETACTCKTSNSACRAGCTHERVIDRTCPVHGEKVSDG